jgi:uncharacterized membrane protein
MSENGKSQNTLHEKMDLEKITRIVLIAGILLTSSFILYDLLKPKEEYILFSIENTEGKIEDFPTEINVGQDVGFRFYIANRHLDEINITVSVHKGNNETVVSRTEGFQNSTIVKNYSLIIPANTEYSSEIINVTFDSAGENMITGLQLNMLNTTTGEYDYLEGYVVYLRVKVLE